MIKIMKKASLAMLALSMLSSCALMLNDEKASVYISSNPPGASVIIEGRNYGYTPIKLSLTPRSYDVSLIKEGYGVGNVKLEAWQGIESGADGGRCLADAIGGIFLVTFYSAFYSDSCKIFKEEEYSVNIPYTASGRNNQHFRHQDSGASQYREPYIKKDAEEYGGSEEGDYMIRRGYGRSRRLPVY